MHPLAAKTCYYFSSTLIGAMGFTWVGKRVTTMPLFLAFFRSYGLEIAILFLRHLSAISMMKDIERRWPQASLGLLGIMAIVQSLLRTRECFVCGGTLLDRLIQIGNYGPDSPTRP
jgi:hypothetical protein